MFLKNKVQTIFTLSSVWGAPLQQQITYNSVVSKQWSTFTVTTSAEDQANLDKLSLASSRWSIQ